MLRGEQMTRPEDDELLKSGLDEEQREAALRSDENVLLLAPPGSGKTRVLVHAAAHRVRHADALIGYPARVMCLTFGVDAAREMRARLEARPLAVPHHRMVVSNYHGLAARLLGRYGHLIGWPRDAAILPPPANQQLMEEAIRDLGIRNLTASNAANAVSHLKGRRSVGAGARSDSLEKLRERYDALMAKRNLRDFDDLILHTLQLLKERPSVQGILGDAYPFLFVDELQDTNLLQLDLLAQIAVEGVRVFAVADDDQMIYGWRDAYPENITEFIETFRAKEIPLTGNYRCPPQIVAAANAVIELNDRRRTELMESRVDDRVGELAVVTALQDSEPNAVAGEIARSIAAGVPAGRIAVLAPHRFKFPEIEEALTAAGIRHVQPGSGVLANEAVGRLIRLSLRRIGGGVITAEDTSLELAGTSFEGRIEELSAAVDLAALGPPRGLLNRILNALDLGSTRSPASDPDLIRLLATMFRKAVDDDRPNTSADLAASVILNWDRLEAAALRAEEAVKVMTSYTAKGTEYEVVILPFMNDGLVPYVPRGQEIDWEEARRLFYVALTRAENRLVLTHDGNKPPSALLKVVEKFATEHSRT